MDKKIYYNNLYDYYGNLLTKKQKAYFEAYYFHDLSLAEIAENNKISRNAVSHQLNIVKEKLEEYENLLHLYEKGKKIDTLLENIKDEKLKEKIRELV